MPPQWAKVAADLDSNPKIRRAGRNGREVFLFILRRVSALDAAGVVPAENIEPWYLSDVLQMSEEDAAEGVKRCVTSRLLRVTDGNVEVVGWNEDWGKRPATGAERTAKTRAKGKAEPETAIPANPGHVTEPTLHNVTGNGCNALDKIREEKKRVEESTSHTPKPRAPRAVCVPLPLDWTPGQEAHSYAQRHGVDARRIVEDMRDWNSAGGKRTNRADWTATFRTFVRRAADQRTKGGGQRGADPTAVAMSELRRLEAEEALRNGEPGAPGQDLWP